MAVLARLMYRALVWKERQRARFGDGAAKSSGRAGHLETGERGETLAYWFLRRSGYTMVARNRRARGGELDLIGWDGPVLAFVEVKTRASDAQAPPEAAVTHAKRRRLMRAAREYLRRLPRQPQAYRYDVVSLVWDAQAGLRVRLTKDAFKET